MVQGGQEQAHARFCTVGCSWGACAEEELGDLCIVGAVVIHIKDRVFEVELAILFAEIREKDDARRMWGNHSEGIGWESSKLPQAI